MTTEAEGCRRRGGNSAPAQSPGEAVETEDKVVEESTSLIEDDDLCFPQLPSFPPSWRTHAAWIHWWLIVFMTCVGALKSAGFLRHDLSQIAGLLELIGALVFLPRWPAYREVLGKAGPDTAVRLGCWCILAGLGVIISTYKRKSIVCWSQLVLTLELLRTRGSVSSVLSGMGVSAAGVAFGLGIQDAVRRGAL